MAEVDFATTLPEHAVEVLRDRARQAGLSLSDWLARAIYDKAARESAADPVDETVLAERRRFVEETEAERASHFNAADLGSS